MSDTNEKKFYTPINLKRCIGKNEQPYIGVTVMGIPHKVDDELRSIGEGKTVVSFRMSIQNRTPYIEKMLEDTPDTDATGTTWAQVSFFNERADRFLKFMAKHPKPMLVITGAMSINGWDDRDGGPHKTVRISADDFFFARDFEVKQGDASAAPAKSKGYQPPAPKQQPTEVKQPSQPAGNGGFTEIDDDDGDLPF